jgi:hypothetical protein
MSNGFPADSMPTFFGYLSERVPASRLTDAARGATKTVRGSARATVNKAAP